MIFSIEKKISLIIVIAYLITDSILKSWVEFLHFLIPKRFRRKTITGQTVLINGAGNGIGRQLAIEFSKHSVCLVMLDADRNSLILTEKLLNPGSRTFIYDCDVSDRERVYQVANDIKKQVGKVDILVNKADIVLGRGFLDIPDEKIVETLQVNLLSQIWMCKAFLPDMMQSNKGHIVSVASLAGMSGMPNLTDYCASKFAAIGFMDSLKIELIAQKKDGIKLTLVCPSLISTGLFEGTKPLFTVQMKPEYVASKIVNAVLEEKDLLILPGWMYILILLKWTMPRRAVEMVYAKCGVLESMDTFKGRATNNNNQI